MGGISGLCSVATGSAQLVKLELGSLLECNGVNTTDDASMDYMQPFIAQSCSATARLGSGI